MEARRHVHDIFVQEGATNVKWVWSPHVITDDCSDKLSLDPYPGDSICGLGSYGRLQLGHHPPAVEYALVEFRRQIECSTYKELGNLAPLKTDHDRRDCLYRAGWGQGSVDKGGFPNDLAARVPESPGGSVVQQPLG